MAHGNFSDLAALALIAAAWQCAWRPDLFTQDLGPLKATFSKQSPDMARLCTFAGGLLFTVALTFSGVKWNPANGKMAGLGCFLSAIWCTLYPDALQRFTLLSLYGVVIFLGGVHIFMFPSNPLTPKGPNSKNNHGNMSDKVAMFLLVISSLMIWYPDPYFQDIGGVIKADFTKSDEVQAMLKFCGGLLFTIAMMFSGIKWNPTNGKMAGIGLFVCAGSAAYSTFNADGGVFVPRLFYAYVAALFVGGLHVFAFPSNPMPPKGDKKAE